MNGGRLFSGARAVTGMIDQTERCATLLLVMQVLFEVSSLICTAALGTGLPENLQVWHVTRLNRD